MRLPHRRFTVRAMMISVAVVASLLTIPTCVHWFEDSTYYANGYSDGNFMSIRHGMQESDVIRILGEPLKVEEVTEYIEWIYGPSHLRVSDHVEPYTLQEPVRSADPSSYTVLIADLNGKITFASGGYLKVNEQFLVGTDLASMESRFGNPLRILCETARRYLVYSDTIDHGSYNVRKIGIDEMKRVNNIVMGWYRD